MFLQIDIKLSSLVLSTFNIIRLSILFLHIFLQSSIESLSIGLLSISFSPRRTFLKFINGGDLVFAKFFLFVITLNAVFTFEFITKFLFFSKRSKILCISNNTKIKKIDIY